MAAFCLVFSVAVLFMLGLVMIFNTSSADVIDHESLGGTHQALVKQLMYGLVGSGLAWGVWRMGYQWFLRASPFLLAMLTVLLGLVLLPGVGREINGARRWLQFAGFSLQPSEFVKYLLPAFGIYYLQKIGPLQTFSQFVKVAALLSLPLLLILVEPNHGTAGVVGLSLLLLCLLLRVPFRYWGWPLVVLLALLAFSAYQMPYVAARFTAYLSPEKDLMGKGHQPYQAKIAVGAGQLYGRGPGKSLQKLSYLPEAQNDYIAAIYAEEFGFLGMCVLLILYLLVAVSSFSLASLAKDPAGLYLGASIFFLFSFQTFLNLGVVSGLLPSTGLNLPFFSQGGSSLIANFMGVGLFMSLQDPY